MRPSESHKDFAIVAAAARAGGIGVIDLTFAHTGDEKKSDKRAFDETVRQLESAVHHLVQSTSASESHRGSIGIKLQSDQVERFSGLLTFLGQQDSSSSVILVPANKADNKLASAVKLAKRKKLFVFVEAISLDEAKLAKAACADAVIIKGHESGGRTGDETTFVLLQRCLKEKIDLPLYAHGGVGVHTAAACYVAGAAGIVLDSQLLLCRESAVSPLAKSRLAKMDGSETQSFGLQFGEAWRFYFRPGMTIADALENEIREIDKNNDSGSDSRTVWRQAIHKQISARIDANLEDIAWFLGQDAAYAKTLAKKYGTVSGVMKAIWQAIDEQIVCAEKAKPLAAGSPLATSHKTEFPILQGAMTRVSDCADFALSVAKGGALPFLALALMRRAEIEKLLVETKEKLGDVNGGLSWGVGILGFVPQELREEQMEVIKQYKPPFALIAGGRPDQAKSLEDIGIATYLHVPSPLLLASFCEQGSRRFIFEGKECGGHVGPRSSFVLWESMVEALLDAIGPKDDASQFHIVFAGGIHDHVSAAMVAALAAPLVARGCRIGVLMGTAYLFTKEAVDSGAIVEKFQKAALKCDQTVLLETGPGHAIRCIESPYKAIFDSHRKKLEREQKSRNEIREELEMMNLGRLRIASKGVARDPKAQAGQSKLVNLSEDAQWSDGMYMIGQVASMHKNVLTIKDLHEQVSITGTKLIEQFAKSKDLTQEKPEVKTFAKTSAKDSYKHREEDIAIIGMSCLLPKANHLDTYWSNILKKVDAIEEVPENQWRWQDFYDENRLAHDKIYSKWGGFLADITFDPSLYGIPPASLASIDPMQLLMLEITAQALKDAGYQSRPFDRKRTSLVLANAGHAPITALYSLRSMMDWKLKDIDPEVRAQIKKQLPEWTEDSFPGFLGNVAAGRVTNRFDLSGINFSVDAACASSLAALYIGVRELRNHTSDMMLVAAADTHNQPGDYMSFSKVHALSPRGKCRTFDATADGIVISEGLAMLVLKRLSDAERDGDRIYAIIKGIAGSSDGRDLSLTAPRPAGQALSLERAYEDAGISPASVSLIEAHGTGTTAGDKAELEALKQVFGKANADKRACAVGSVKSMIGHTKSTAGLASIIKIAKALHHKVLPPTIGVTEPNPACNFSTSPFYINSESRPWITNELRRAGVSAFGFGGTNFHTVLEEYQNDFTRANSFSNTSGAELFCLRASSQQELIKQAESLRAKAQSTIANVAKDQDGSTEFSRLAHSTYLRFAEFKSSENNLVTLSIVATSLADLEDKISRATKSLADDTQVEIKDPRGIYYSQASATEQNTKNKIAFLFPGQGSQKVNMLRELALDFPEVQEVFAYADQVLQASLPVKLSSYVYPTPAFSKDEEAKQEESLTNTHIAQPAVACADMAMWHLLKTFGVNADIVAGHSFGEYVALCVAEAFGESELFSVAEARGKMLSESNGNQKGSMAAVSGSAKEVQELVRELPGVTLANINSPNQCILSGEDSAIKNALAILSQKQIAARPIAVSAAFHSPHMEYAQSKLKAVLDSVKFASPSVPVFSNTDAKPHPDSPQAIATRLVEHLIKPVQFVNEIEEMYASGAHIFVEVGPGAVLTNLVDTILDGKPHIAISSDRPGRHGTLQLLHLLAQLSAVNIPVDISRLFNQTGEASQDTASEKSSSSSKRPRLLYRINSAEIKQIPQAQPIAKGSPEQTMKTSSTQDALQPSTNDKPQTQPVAANQATASNPVSPQVAAVMPTNSPTQATYTPMPNQTPQNLPNLMVPGSNVDQVMLRFQQSMAEMTNNFLQAQQNVMLAYLKAKQGQPIDFTQVVLPQQVMNQVHYPQAPMQIPVQAPVQSNILPYAQTLPVGALTPAGNGGNGGNGHGGNGHNGAHTSTPVQTAPADVQTNVQVVAPAPDNNAINADELIAKFMEIVSERTGYPADMLDLSLDMEADLGIDSIKRVEILSNFRKLLPESTQQNLEGSVEKLAAIKTLQGIIDWIRELGQSAQNQSAQSQSTQPSAAPVQTTPPVSSQAALQASEPETNKEYKCHISRGRIKLVDLPPVSQEKFTSDKVIVISDDQTGIADELVNQFSNNNQKVALLRHSTASHKNGNQYSLDLTNIEAVKSALASIEKDQGTIGGFIHLLSLAEAKKETATPSLAALDVRSFFVLCKGLEPLLNVDSLYNVDNSQSATVPSRRPFIVAATAMGGDYASGKNALKENKQFYPVQAGVVGIAKSLDRELTNVKVRSIDFASTMSASEVANSLINELSAQDAPVEVGIQKGKRFGLEVVPEIVESANNGTDSITLDRSSIVLVTGGARGITADLTQELADLYKPTLVIVGKSPRPEANEPGEFASLSKPRELKAAIMESIKNEGKSINIAQVETTYQKIMRDREIRANLARFEKAGSKVHYFACDVQDVQAFGGLIDTIYEMFGKIDGVIYGAGVIEDSYLKDKTLDSFDRVFHTKVNGAITLSQKLNLSSLKFLTFLSSVVGRTGNAGQCDYVAANEVMNKLSVWLDKQTPSRLTSIMWGPWRGGMARPELESIFAQQGWSMIDSASGRRAFNEEIHFAHKGDVEVLLVGMLESPPLPGSGKEATQTIKAEVVHAGGTQAPAFGARLHKSTLSILDSGMREHRVLIDPAYDLYLNDHKFDSTPVMPMAMCLEMMAEAATQAYPGWYLTKVTNLDIPSGIVFESGAKELIVLCQEESQSDEKITLKLSVNTGTKILRAHFRAIIELSKTNSRSETKIPFDFDVNAITQKVIPTPSLKFVYDEWLFHGPTFQGITAVDALGMNGIVGKVRTSEPKDCLANTNGKVQADANPLYSDQEWVIDPIFFDSSMQVAGIWARQYLEMTCIPTGFRALHILGSLKKQPLTVRVFIPDEIRQNILRCDLAAWDADGKPVIWIEDLGGVGSKSLNRLAEKPKV